MNRTFSHYLLRILLCVMLGLSMSPLSHGAKQDEYQVKAAFILNFAKLTEWPTDAPGDRDSFPIAILGKAPSDSFTATLKSLTVHGSKIIVKRIDSVDEAKNARLVFIAASERHRLPALLKELRHRNILTVSDMSSFCENGGMIGLLTIQSKVAFEINLGAVHKTRLSISSQLLKLAKTIYGD